MSNEKDLIEEFKKQYSSPDFGTTICTDEDDNIKVCSEDGDCTVKDGLSQNEAIDVVDEMAQTPPTEIVVKRSAANTVCHENDDEHGSQTSTKKMQKLMEVKKESLDLII